MSPASPQGAIAAPSTISLWSSLGIAVVAHALIFALMPSFASLRASMRLDPVDLEIISPPPLATPPPEPTPPAPDPVAPPEPTPVVPPPRRVRAPRPETAPEPPPTPTPQTPQPPAPLQETPVRMDGINLTGTGTGSGFAIDLGSGEDRQGPLSPPGTPTGRRVQGSPQGVPGGTGQGTGPRVVPLADLSRRPSVPDLADRVHEEYPERARREGVLGRATVHARVDPDGRVRLIRGSTATRGGYGFAEACERVVRASRWSPPLDRDGQPVAVWITYNCGWADR